jgi:hypothetical protein
VSRLPLRADSAFWFSNKKGPHIVGLSFSERVIMVALFPD